MASISTDPQGNRKIQFTPADGGRRAVRLGKVSLRIAQEVKTKIEYLANAKAAGVAPDLESQKWLNAIGDDLADKLAAVGLCPVRQTAKLGVFLEEMLLRRPDVKAVTKVIWQQPVRNLVAFFGRDKPMTAIHEGDAADFKSYLVMQDLASSTLAKRLQFTRQFFEDARRRKIIASNPFAGTKAVAVVDKDRQHYISPGDTEKLLGAADPTWRTIIGLSRFGGLRCPSEVLSLKWSDVNWETNRITVSSPKTEHHPGKEYRVIPLFPELKPILEEAFELAPEGAVYIVHERYRKAAMTPNGWANANLRTQLTKIIRRAGLLAWPKTFHNMRASRETDLMKDFPIHVVTAWLGNSPQTAMKHYLQIRDEDFDRAAMKMGGQAGSVPEKGGSNSVSLAAQKAYQHPSAPFRTEPVDSLQSFELSGVMRRDAEVCDTVQVNKWTILDLNQ